MTLNEERRFRAYRDNDIVYVSGCASNVIDSSRILTELVETKSQVLDLSGMLPSTWIGLRDLHRAVTELTTEATFVNVPAEIFRHLKIIDSEVHQIRFGSADIYVLAPGNKVKPQPVDLEQVEFDESGFAHYNRQVLIGLGPMVGPGWDVHASDGISPAERFILDYVQFLGATVNLGGGIVKNLELEILEINKRLRARLTTYDHAFSEWLAAHTPLASELAHFGENIHAAVAQPNARSEAFYQDFLGIVAMVQSCAQAKDWSGTVRVFQHLTGTLSAMQDLTDMMEGAGTSIGDRIYAFTFPHRIMQALDLMKELTPNAEQLEAIRDAFDIMDPEGENSWPETHAYLVREANEINAIYSELSTALQGFDLARQILEHRVAELHEICAATLDSEDSVVQFAATIHDLICASLVSDQETLAYAAFFPAEKQARNIEEKVPPGELLFF